MNPFELRGPEFLLFYFCFSLVVIYAIAFLRRRAESGPAPKIDLGDPYLVAYLRGGENEALRVAAVSLVDRGLLIADDENLKAKKGSLDKVRRPIEKALLQKFAQSHKATIIFGDSLLKASCSEYQTTLSHLSLLPDEATK